MSNAGTAGALNVPNADLTTAAPVATATVDVRSAWLSKINWTQAVGTGASALVLITGGKINIPLAEQAEIVILIQALQGLVTWALKTFSHPSVTPSQVKKATA